MIFQKRRSYPFVLFIPREYFSFKNVKLNTKNWNYPAKNDFTVMIFQKPRSYPIVLVIPESFLTLILCPFWHEHAACHTKRIQHSSIRLRYHTKLLLWLMIRFGLPNLQIYPKIIFFLRPSRVSTIKLTYVPAGKVDNYPFQVWKWKYYDCVFLCCAATTSWDHCLRHERQAAL